MLRLLITYLFIFGFVLLVWFSALTLLRSTLLIYGTSEFLHFLFFSGIFVTQHDVIVTFLIVFSDILTAWCSMEDFWGSTIWHDVMVNAWHEKEELDRIAVKEWEEKEKRRRVRDVLELSYVVPLLILIRTEDILFYIISLIFWLMGAFSEFQSDMPPPLPYSPPPSSSVYLDFLAGRLAEAFKK
jgi:hypothetical protein